MQTMVDETPIQLKTRELCQTILSEPSVQSIRQRIDAFLADTQTRSQYDELVAKGQGLQEKQQQGQPLTSEEIANFEQQRDAFLGNPVARGFLDAQEEMHQVQKSVQKYVSKTLELGRLPTEDELSSGACDGHGGCGSCGH